MQVQHESQLLESVPIKLDDLPTTHGKSLDSYALSQNVLAPIEGLLNCPSNNHVIAVYLSNLNQIQILDTKTRTRRERFPLKACDKKFSKQSFIVKGIDFSPDGQRVAIGQSDSIIYIYKLPNIIIQSPSRQAIETTTANSTISSSTKPTITGKFVCSSPITCLLWSEYGVIFGSQDGKVKLIFMPSKSNETNQSARVINLYASTKNLMPISLSYKTNTLAIGYLDSTIILLYNLTLDQLVSSETLTISSTINSPPVDSLHQASSRRGSSITNASAQSTLFSSFNHLSPVNHLVILTTSSLCCSGSDGRVSFYHFQTSDPLTNPKIKLNVGLKQSIDIRDDITAVDYSSINETLVLASKTRLQFIRYDQESTSWRLQSSFISLDNSTSITKVLWTRDGSQLLAGTSSGSLELFKCNWSKQSLGEQLDICHIAKNRVRITDRSRNLLATYKTQCDIKRVNLLNSGRDVIIWTTGSLLLARLARSHSELPWTIGDRGAKFCFDFPGYVLIFRSTNKELSLVRLGQDSVLHKLKLDHANRKLVSIGKFPPDLGDESDSNNNNKNSPMRERSATRTLRQASANSDSDARLTVPEARIVDNSNQSSLLIDSPVDSSTAASGEQSTETVREKFVYVTESGYSLNMIDLKTNIKQVVLRHKVPIKMIKFCLSASHLIFTDCQERLYMLSDLDREIHEPKLVASDCKFCDWIPETDILVVQSNQRILIWYSIVDEAAGTKVVELDSRSYNSSKQPPILDLSLLENKTPYPIVTKATWDRLYLSNGSTAPLDKLKVKYNREVLCHGLESAFEALNREDPSLGSAALWSQLGWLSIEQANLPIAMKSFSKIGYKGMIKFLESCAKKAEEEQTIMLMKLTGKWDTFEQTAESSEIISTYRRLNKWSRLIDYLSRMQQFRQRDLAEQDHRSWLESKHRYIEAANSLAKSGDLISGLRLLNDKQKFTDAAELLVSTQRTPLRNLKTLTQLDGSVMNLANQIKSKLIEEQRFKEAARVCDKALGDLNEALELYLRGKDFEPALQLAAELEPKRLGEIEVEYGDQLMELYKSNRLSKRLASPAIDHYLNAQLATRALESAIELRYYDRAYEILMQLPDDQLTDESSTLLEKLADYMISQQENDKAIEVLTLSKQYDRVAKLHLDEGNFEKSFQVSLRHIYDSNREHASREFIEIAKNLANQGKIQEAEEIYLMLDQSDLAIEMHKQHKNYERMLELTEQLHPDLLEATLFQLAKELEICGQYELAETYLLRASQSEWVNVVRMHRVVGRYEDAYRVARANCSSDQDPLLVQLAFWWAKSLVGPQNEATIEGEQRQKSMEQKLQEARDLLRRLKVANEVVEFCCENKNFQFALDLCSEGENGEATVPTRRREILRRYATFLEQQHKFDQAEEILLRDGEIELVARMYIDNDMQSEAIRVVEEQLALATGKPGQQLYNREQLVELLNNTLIQCANKMAEDAWPVSGRGSSPSTSRPTTAASWDVDSMSKLATAQQLYLRAQKPELAVELYKQRGLWQEAIQVAQRFAPRLLEGVERALDEQVCGDLGPIVAMAAASRSSSRSGLTQGDGKSSTASATRIVASNNYAKSGRLKLKTQAEIDNC